LQPSSSRSTARKKLLAVIERLSTAIESGDGTLLSLTSRLKDRERDLAIVRSRRQELLDQAGRKAPLPTAAKLLEHLEAVKGQLLGLTEKPDHVPQWCSKHWLKAGNRKTGGRRRKAS